MSRYDTSTLVQRIRRRAYLPAAGGSYSDADLLSMADEALDVYLLPLLMRTREEYLVAHVDTLLTVGEASYGIPTGAMGSKLRSVQLLDREGRLCPNLVRVEPEQEQQSVTGGVQGVPWAFLVEDTSVRLLPEPGNEASGYTLRLSYHRQPSTLVALTAVATVTAVNTGTGALTLSNGATALGGDGSKSVDVVRALPGFDVLASTSGTLSGTGATLTLSPASVASVAAGDYVCVQGQSPVPQVPAVTHALLALYVAEGCLKASGNLAEAQALADERQRAEEGALHALTPRTEGHARRVPNGMAKWRGRVWG